MTQDPPELKLVGLKGDARIHIYHGSRFADRTFKTMCGAVRPAHEARPEKYMRSRGWGKTERVRCVQCFEEYRRVHS